MDMKEARAGAKGAVKGIGSFLKGQTGIFVTLTKEHGMVSSLMNQVLEGDLAVRPRLFREVGAELWAHAKAEEEVFYAALLQHPETKEAAEHAIDEHEEVKELLEDLEEMNFASEAWLTKFKAMRESVEHHAQEEENELFPLANETLANGQQSELDARFVEAKKRYKESYLGSA